MKQLADSQLKTFDMEYVDDERWAPIAARIARDFPDGRFRFLDVGGGNGLFADQLLERYPRSHGTVLDNSSVLLSLNKPHERKSIIEDSAENLGQIQERFDLVFVNWVLHHLVGDTYTETRRHQLMTLRAIKSLLKQNGKVSIYENNYSGWLLESLPGRIIFTLTSSKLLSRVVGKMGANTAGVGVCFLSKEQWLTTIARAGFRVMDFEEPDRWIWPIRWEWRLLLHLKRIRTGHYWIASA